MKTVCKLQKLGSNDQLFMAVKPENVPIKLMTLLEKENSNPQGN